MSRESRNNNCRANSFQLTPTATNSLYYGADKHEGHWLGPRGASRSRLAAFKPPDSEGYNIVGDFAVVDEPMDGLGRNRREQYPVSEMSRCQQKVINTA